MKKVLLAFITTLVILSSAASPVAGGLTLSWLFLSPPREKVLSDVTYSLSNRYKDTFVNEVFADNILLTLAYLSGSVRNADQISWKTIQEPSESKLILKPGETFAFHDTAFEKYQGKIAATTNAHFNFQEGFRSSGYLVGDGVCHLASFLKVAAKKAGLMIEAPVSHDFAPIPDVAREDGVSIYYTPFDKNTSTQQNLYITNNKSNTIAFVFSHKNHELNIKVQELN